MKRIFFILLILLAFAVPSQAVVQSLGGTCLTGGGTGCLDSYNGSTFSDLDVAFIITGGLLRVYRLDADSGLGESSPDVIKPDASAGLKRWILINTTAVATHSPSHTDNTDDIQDADDDSATKGISTYDNTDFNATVGVVTIVDDGHAHTGTSISSVDISDDTNLAVTSPVVLSDDTLSLTITKDIVATSPITVNGGANLDNILVGSDTDITIAIADADDDGATKGAASFDNTDFNAAAGNVTIVDDGHLHTATSILEGREWSIADSGITDQCDATESGSVEDIAVNDIGGANPGTIFFGHTSGDAQTTYTFTGGTCADITANITLVIEQGAVLYTDSSNNQEILGDLQAGLYEIFQNAPGETGRFLFGETNDITSTGRIREVYPDWWGAVVDGSSDEGNEIQEAINSLNDNGGIVFMRGGLWYVNTAISIPAGTTLKGVGYGYPTNGNEITAAAFGANAQGTWIVVDNWGTPGTFTPLNISDASTVTISDMGFFYIHQDYTMVGGWTPRDYDWTIEITGDSNDWKIENVMLLNVYDGIRQVLIGGGAAPDRGEIYNVKGQPLHIGIQLEFIADVGRVTDIHFWPFWVTSTGGGDSPRDYVQDNAQGLILQRLDNWQFTNIFTFGMKYGIVIKNTDVATGTGTDNGNQMKFVDVDIDIPGTSGVYFHPDLSGGTSQWINFTSFGGVGGADGALDQDTEYSINMQSDNHTAQFTNLKTAVVQNNLILVQGSGNKLMVDNYIADRWNFDNGGHVGVWIGTGNEAWFGTVLDSTPHPGFTTDLFGGAGTIYTSAGSYNSGNSSVDSGASMAAPWGATLITVNGVADINTITNMYHDRTIMLFGAGAWTAKDGAGNLELNGDFTSAGDNDDILTLICDGSSWFEVSRSLN